ncbi:hypothetical protein HBI81_165980 [Parastagonospora nodorum]|nr:hypothetical protein HBH53_225540 [Parastagonospora nodorum]KAH3967387.1 hypothetical protein HBH52_189330 [Parastagonospora nodorum]KAH4045112.1 hypothetical protein HBH49_205040 [Parastagonospora nodorum]KAH4112121.1 hypothetical protein HBH47_230660 [Parastagonospora nodorum]KAH4153377.1 hypothetical protein HBH43_225240 [Parastagonospora nodorum]
MLGCWLQKGQQVLRPGFWPRTTSKASSSLPNSPSTSLDPLITCLQMLGIAELCQALDNNPPDRDPESKTALERIHIVQSEKKRKKKRRKKSRKKRRKKRRKKKRKVKTSAPAKVPPATRPSPACSHNRRMNKTNLRDLRSLLPEIN